MGDLPTPTNHISPEARDKVTRRANHFRFSEIVSSPSAKNIPLVTSGKSLAGVAHPGPPEGRFAIATLRRAGIAMDAVARQTTGQGRTVKSCGPGAAMLASSSWEASFSGMTVANSPFTGESTK